jgi:hypothetical protein
MKRFFFSPALMKAKDMAKSISCANNEKTLVLAHILYADAFDGWLPMARKNITDSYGSAYRWYKNPIILDSISNFNNQWDIHV